jgi:dTDP-4-amino-4,6-dideoxygalactose transaminase
VHNFRSVKFDGMFRQLSAYFADESVPISPSLSFRSVVGSRPGVSSCPFPFDHERTVYTFSGTGAIYQAAKVLGLSAGENLLCPAYNCGHEIDPFLRQNVKVKLFSVTEGLQADVDHLTRQIDQQTRAVLVTHYFGFPQALDQIRSICNERGLFLIEDCAHCLFSKDRERPLGIIGDLAVFSMRKSLPIPNGGALVINNPHLKLTENLSEPASIATWSKMLDLWVRSLKTAVPDTTRSLGASALLVGMLPLVIARKLARKLWMWDPLVWHDLDDESFCREETIYSWKMASIGQRIIKGIEPDLVVFRRRSNYEYLLDALAETGSVRPIYRTLPRSVCPLYFPVFVDQPEQMVQDLARQKVGAIRWWGTFHPAIKWEEFPRESFFKRHVVALPVHQDLTHRHLQELVEAIRREPQFCDKSPRSAVRM